MQQQVQTFPDRETMSRAAAHELTSAICRSVEQQGRCSLVLSGGSSPRRLYELLARPPYSDQIDWTKLHVFWSDERCVAPDDAGSNYRCACSSLLQHVPLPPGNIHRMPGELDPQQAALTASADIKSFFENRFSGPGSFPSFDIVLLGMGLDGHIASLFSGDDAALQKDTFILPTRAPAGLPTARRLSMSLPLLAAARSTFFIICGPEKQALMDSVLNDDPAVRDYPAARLCARVPAIWFVSAL